MERNRAVNISGSRTVQYGTEREEGKEGIQSAPNQLIAGEGEAHPNCGLWAVAS